MMVVGDVVGYVGLFGAGLLAGEEFVVRYGVRGPLATLDDEQHIRMRQALIRTLRVLVPAIYVPTLVLTVVAAGLGGGALLWRCLAIAALLGWIGVTIGGTIPINTAASTWHPTEPPPDWQTQIDRWEHLNTIRTWLAIAAFALALAATATR